MAPTGRYRLVSLLRDLGVPERHIRATLESELGLTPEEVDAALAPEHRTSTSGVETQSPEDLKSRRG